MQNLKNETNKQNRNKLIDAREQMIVDKQRIGIGGLDEKGERIKIYKFVVTKQPCDVMYSIGNVVNNIIITMYGASQVLEISRETLVKYVIIY